MEGLGLPSPGDLDQLDAKIYLHDLENFISKQVATSYWIGVDSRSFPVSLHADSSRSSYR